MPVFSVIIPTFGRPAFLAEAVESVLTQSVEDLEVLVVDDASPTPVAAPPDPRVRVLRRDVNGGAAAARNVGLGHARGRYVTFLDDDDLYAQGHLEAMLPALEQHPVAVCWSRYVDEPPAPKRLLDGWVHERIAWGTTPHLGATCVRRDVALELDPRFRTVEDVDWWLRMTALATVTTVPRFGYLVRRHPGRRVGYGVERRIADSRLLLEVHEPYFARNPRAAAHRWRRIGLMERQLGCSAAARTAFVRSLRARPTAATAKHLLLSFRPGRPIGSGRG